MINEMQEVRHDILRNSPAHESLVIIALADTLNQASMS